MARQRSSDALRRAQRAAANRYTQSLLRKNKQAGGISLAPPPAVDPQLLNRNPNPPPAPTAFDPAAFDRAVQEATARAEQERQASLAAQQAAIRQRNISRAQQEAAARMSNARSRSAALRRSQAAAAARYTGSLERRRSEVRRNSNFGSPDAAFRAAETKKRRDAELDALLQRVDSFANYDATRFSQAEARGGGGLRPGTFNRRENPLVDEEGNLRERDLRDLDARVQEQHNQATYGLYSLTQGNDRHTIEELAPELLPIIEELVENASQYRGDQLQRIYENITQDVNARVRAHNEANSDNSLGARASRAVGRVFSAPGLKQGVEALGWLQDELVMQPYYAAQYESRTNGESVGGFFRALQAFNPFGTSASEEAVNSYEKRAELTQGGLLDSFGTRLFGDAHIGIGSADFRASALGDLAFQLIDPLDIVGGAAARSLARVGDNAAEAGIRRAAIELAEGTDAGLVERLRANASPAQYLESHGGREAVREAAQAGRTAYIGTRQGRSLLDMAEHTIDDTRPLGKGGDVVTTTELTARLNSGGSFASASVVEDLMKIESREGRVQALMDAFVEGTYRPNVTVRRQLAAGIGVQSAWRRASMPVLLGQAVANPSRGWRKVLDSAANGTVNNTTVERTRNSATVVRNSATRAATYTPHGYREDYWNAVVRSHLPKTANGDIADVYQRFDRIVEQVDNWSPLLPLDEAEEAAVKAFAEDLLTADFKRLDSLVNTKDPAALATVEDHLINMEVFYSILRGEGGLKARREALYQLRQTFTRDVDNIDDAIRHATADVGGKKSLVDPYAPLPSPSKAGIGRMPKANLRAEWLNAGLKRMRTDLEKSLRRRRQELRSLLRDLTSPAGRYTPEEEAQLRAVMEALADNEAKLQNLGLYVADARLAMFDSNVEAAVRASANADEARRAVQVELSRIQAELTDAQAEAALRNFGRLDPGDVLALTPRNIQSVKNRAEALTPTLKAAVRAELDEVIDSADSNGLRNVAKKVEVLRSNPEMASRADTYLKNAELRKSVEIGDGTATGAVSVPAVREGMGQRAFLGVNPVRGAARMLSSIMEARPPTHIRFVSSANEALAKAYRAEDMVRYTQALHFDRRAIAEMERLMFRDGLTELDIREAVEQVVGAFATREGVDPDALLDILHKKWADDRVAFSIANPDEVKIGSSKFTPWRKDNKVLGDVKLSEDVQVVAQKAEGISVPDPEELYAAVRQLRTATVDGALSNPFAYLRTQGARVLDRQIARASFADNPLTLRRAAKGFHRFWKFAVVTNLHTGAIGFGYGLFGTDGDPSERLHAGLQWGALGLSGSLRYIGRVAGIEEGFRKVMQPGFTPPELIPYYSKWRAYRDNLIPSRTDLDVGAWNHPLENHDSKWLRTLGHNWTVYARGDTRYVDAWYRIVNHQIHPDSDPVTRLLLMAKGEVDGMTYDQARTLIREYLDGPDGAIFRRRITDTAEAGVETTADAIIDRYQRFIDYFIPDAQLARDRLHAAEAGVPIPRSQLRQLRKSKEVMSPPVIHAQETWRVPKNFGELWQTLSKTVPRMVLETPTAQMNRIPLMRRIYHDEFVRLRAMGMDDHAARDLAEQSAVNQTNRVMFRQDDQSRFASKADFYFPFQQPREEMLRVYAGMLSNNKARALNITRLGAVAFNNGEESGIFRKDPYTGNWTMRVPGSAWLSDLLGLGGTSFELSPWDLTFMFRGMQGSPADWGNLDSAVDLAWSVMPTPGGPYWSTLSRFAFNVHPEWHDQVYGTWVYERLFPYGAQGTMFTPFSRRMWMAMTGSTPPWEFASRQEMQNELNRIQQEVYLQLLWEHLQENPGDTEWTPDIEDVRDGTHDMLLVWSILSAVTPASVRANMNYEDELEALKADYEDEDGKLNYTAFLQAYPELAPFVTVRSGEWVGPQTYEWWSREDEDRWRNYALHYERRLSVEEFDDAVKEGRRRSEMYAAFDAALSIPGKGERGRAMNAFYEEYGEEWELNDTHLLTMEVADIINSTSASQVEAALNEWRIQKHNLGVDISFNRLQDLRRKAAAFRHDPWKESRSAVEVEAWIRSQTRKGVSFEDAFSELSPVEQVKYAQLQRSEMFYSPGITDPERFMDEYNEWGARIGAIYGENPELAKGEDWQRGPNAPPIPVQAWRRRNREHVTAYYDEISRTSAARNEAYEKARAAGSNQRLWAEWRTLRDKVKSLRAELLAYQNRIYNEGAPGLSDVQRDIKGLVLLEGSGFPGMNLLARFGRAGVEAWGSNEENDFFNRTPDAQAAYLASLEAGLNLAVENSEYVPGKLLWEWMTDFQKSLLERNFPPEQINEWKGVTTESASADSNYNSFRSSRYTWRRPVANVNDGSNALYYAYDLFKFYNQRGNRPEPPAYQEYLKLPQNPAVRADFLRKHPEVAEWVRLGPLANMPEVYRYIVIDIMVRNGKWEGEPRDIEAINEIAWAREQLDRWNRRGDQVRPEAYDIWLNMPTGVAKAEYMTAHPEIGQWLQLGPMRNMPEAYQEVVRDIMLRYGEWTESQDPLGMVLSEFYKQPSYARDGFLEKHPELVTYFAALRTPEEQRMFELADGYYNLQDTNARRLYLAAHPELNTYFVEQRTKRYERFLNQVATFMGQNPEMFQEYLERQEDVLGEMITRFGESSLVREVRSSIRPSSAPPARTRTTSGRVRR